jgi:hypothetical protein
MPLLIEDVKKCPIKGSFRHNIEAIEMLYFLHLRKGRFWLDLEKQQISEIRQIKAKKTFFSPDVREVS